MNEHNFWSEWVSLTEALWKTPKRFSIQKCNIFMYAIFHSLKKIIFLSWTAYLSIIIVESRWAIPCKSLLLKGESWFESDAESASNHFLNLFFKNY